MEIRDRNTLIADSNTQSQHKTRQINWTNINMYRNLSNKVNKANFTYKCWILYLNNRIYLFLRACEIFTKKWIIYYYIKRKHKVHEEVLQTELSGHHGIKLEIKNKMNKQNEKTTMWPGREIGCLRCQTLKGVRRASAQKGSRGIVTYTRIDQISKHIKDNGSPNSPCWRRKL